jgi:hypothetical protein
MPLSLLPHGHYWKMGNIYADASGFRAVTSLASCHNLRGFGTTEMLEMLHVRPGAKNCGKGCSEAAGLRVVPVFAARAWLDHGFGGYVVYHVRSTVER